MNAYKIAGHVIFWLTVAAFSAICLLEAFGCNAPQTGQQPAPIGSLPDVVSKVVYRTNWLTTVAIVGVALSAAAFVQGARFALPLFVGCATLLATVLTITAYAKWIAFIGFGIFVVVFAWAIWQKRKNDKNLDAAFREVVTGAQNLKEKLLGEVQNDLTDLKYQKKVEINAALAEPQSDTTRTLVDKVKTEIGLKTNTESQTKSTRGIL